MSNLFVFYPKKTKKVEEKIQNGYFLQPEGWVQVHPLQLILVSSNESRFRQETGMRTVLDAQ